MCGGHSPAAGVPGFDRGGDERVARILPSVLRRLEEARRSGGYDRLTARTDGPLLVLALVFLVVLVLPLVVSDLSRPVRTVLLIANVAIWAAFAADYLAKLALALDRRLFVRQHVPDLIVIVVPMLRPLRAFRIIRLLRVARLGAAAGLMARRSRRSVQARTTTYVVVAVLVLVVVCAALILDMERGAEGANIHGFGDALWWAATTVTTVGYGDRFPVTAEGRLVAVLLMLGGIALLGVLTASLAAWFVRSFSEVEEAVEAETQAVSLGLAQITERLDRIEAALADRPSTVVPPAEDPRP